MPSSVGREMLLFSACRFDTTGAGAEVEAMDGAISCAGVATVDLEEYAMPPVR